MSTHSCTLTIHNKRGLHARASAKLATLANQFPCQIHIGHSAEHLKNAKNILEVMMLAASAGTELYLCAEGEQAELAVRKLTELVEAKFAEEA